MSHRRRCLLHAVTMLSWLIAGTALVVREAGPLRLAETLILMIAFSATITSVVLAAMAPLLAQGRLIITLAREHRCGSCGCAAHDPHSDARVIRLPAQRLRRDTYRV